jgi:integrase
MCWSAYPPKHLGPFRTIHWAFCRKLYEEVRYRRHGALRGKLAEPVDDDPALGWQGSASRQTNTATDICGHALRREPWNKGRLIGQKRPLKPKDVWTIRVRLQMEERKRDLAIFDLAIDSKLRGCDLVRLRIEDVLTGGRVRDRATVVQTKTGRPVQFEITEQTRTAIGDWLTMLDTRRGRYLFPSRFQAEPHLSTRQYARIVHRWVEPAGLDSSAYGTHSLRRPKAAQIYQKTGNLRAVPLLLGHTKLESTVRHLGIEVDDALAISKQVEL